MTRPQYFDLPIGVDPPNPGEILRYPRVDHEVLTVRPVDSNVWPNRWALTTRSLGPHHDRPIPDSKPWRKAWRYRRGETPTDHFDPDR